MKSVIQNTKDIYSGEKGKLENTPHLKMAVGISVLIGILSYYFMRKHNNEQPQQEQEQEQSKNKSLLYSVLISIVIFLLYNMYTQEQGSGLSF